METNRPLLPGTANIWDDPNRDYAREDDEMLVLGAYSDRAMGLLTIPKRNLLHHTAIIGQSGSGKSFAMARLIEELILRTRARILILDPNGDLSRFHEPAEEVWRNPDFEPVLRTIGTKMPLGSPDYDSKSTFEQRWLSKRFQFVSADRRNWTPFREGALAAPLRLHWKWLGAEQNFLLSVDATQYPKINQGIVSCFHYIDDNREQYPQGYSLEDLEDIAQSFALKRVAMADYPEAYALDEVDWLAVRLQFRELRKRFYKLWYPGLLKEQTSAPSDLSNYMTNGFRHQAPWQACVVGLAGLDLDHMLLAADVALYQLWIRSVFAWQEARERKARFNDLHEDASRAGDDEALDKVAPLEIREPDVTTERSPDVAVWQDRRVPTFIVIDEAHNFAPQDPATALQARVSERIASVAAEGRKYGLFVILASQRPQKLRRGLLSECENSCLLRIQSKVEQAFAAEAFGEPLDTVNKVREFHTGEALMMGRWVAGTPTCKFAPSRTTVGGGGLHRDYWTDPS